MDLNLMFIILIIVFVIALLAVLIYSGITAPINVVARKSPYGQLRIAYKKHIGPYSSVGDVFGEVHKLAPLLTPLGIYFDDPKTTAGEDCRSAIGVILDFDETEETEKELLKHGYSIYDLPDVENIVYTTFPYITQVSLYIAVWRVYPALIKYISENELQAYPFLEIYEQGSIHFVAPLSNQKDFFPPDLKEPVRREKKPTQEQLSRVPEQEKAEVAKTSPDKQVIETQVLEEVSAQHQTQSESQPPARRSPTPPPFATEEIRASLAEEDDIDPDMAEFEAKLERLERELTNRTKNSNSGPAADPIAEIEEHLKRSGHSLDNDSYSHRELEQNTENIKINEVAHDTNSTVDMDTCQPSTQAKETQDADDQTVEEQVNHNTETEKDEENYQKVAKDIVKSVVKDAKNFLIEEQQQINSVENTN